MEGELALNDHTHVGNNQPSAWPHLFNDMQEVHYMQS